MFFKFDAIGVSKVINYASETGIAAGGEPTIGNANYRLDLGFIFPILAGCGWESNFYFSIAYFSDAESGASIAAPIPADPTLAGATFYSQALFLLNGAEQTSNGVARSLGF